VRTHVIFFVSIKRRSGVADGLEVCIEPQGRSDKISIPGGDIGYSHMCCQHGCQHGYRVQISSSGTLSEPNIVALCDVCMTHEKYSERCVMVAFAEVGATAAWYEQASHVLSVCTSSHECSCRRTPSPAAFLHGLLFATSHHWRWWLRRMKPEGRCLKILGLSELQHARDRPGQ
jgi:hypothetical protein